MIHKYIYTHRFWNTKYYYCLFFQRKVGVSTQVFDGALENKSW